MADMLRGGIVINEILVDPNGSLNFDTDGNGTASSLDEFVELYNASGSAIDISGLELWDAGTDNWFTFPPGSVLEAGARAVVVTGVQPGGSLPTGGPDDLFFDAGRGTAVINNGADNVVVLDPAANEFIQATFNGDTLDDPTAGTGDYSGFPSGATRVGTGEDFGNDTDGESVQREGDGADSFTTGTPSPGVGNICFANGAMLLGPSGEIAVEDLRAGDMLLTADGGAQPVTWLHAKTWTPDEIADDPARAPVVICAGAMGPNAPSRDLRLSQQHRVLVVGAIAERMFGQPEVLIPAKALLPLAGVYVETPTEDVTYFHVMLDQHEVLTANGLACESLYLGPQVIELVSDEALAELCELLDMSPKDLSRASKQAVAARPLATFRRASRLVARYSKHGRALATGE